MPDAGKHPLLNFRIVGGRPVEVSGVALGMEQFLAEPNAPAMVARLGDEIVVGNHYLQGARVTVVRGETFRHSDAEVTGWRYLYRSPDAKDADRIVGALNLTQHQQRGKKATAVLSNIVVAEDFRRRGIASHLVSVAVEQFPGVVLDSAMSELGGALFGFKPQGPDNPQAEPAPQRRPSRKP